MTDPASPPPPPNQPPGPPPGYYRASDGQDYPIPAGHYLGADGQFHPIAAPAPAASTPPPPSAPSAPGVVSTSAGWRWDGGSILLVVGAGLTAFGAFLPWAEIAGLLTKKGTEGDGTITLVLAAIALAVGAGGIVKASKGMLIGSAIAAALIVLVAIIDMADVSSGIDGLDIDVSIGIGLYLTLIGGVLGTVGAVLALRSTSK